jgi:hypothetical protein
MEITKNKHSTKIKQLTTATHQKGRKKTRKMRGRLKKIALSCETGKSHKNATDRDLVLFFVVSSHEGSITGMLHT